MTVGRQLALLSKQAPWRSDQEFLPGAVQILETPASPITAVLTFSICALALVTLAWAYFGRIDVIAVASGKFQPTGRVKVVQPLETGKIVAVHASNGMHVVAGDVLVELDATEARAEEAALAGDLASAQAEAARRRAALAAASATRFSDVQIDWLPGLEKTLQDREERVLAADLRQVSSNIASLEAQLRQKEAEKVSLGETIRSERDLIAVLQDRADMRSKLVAVSAGTKASLLDALETLRYQVTALATQNGQLNQAVAAIDVARHEMAKVWDQFASENNQKLADLEKQIDENGQKLIKARAAADHMTIRSPATGTVQASTVTSVGQVVTTGTAVMRVVPDGSVLEIEAYAKNKDIGFLRVGQQAVVKVESFPFGQYGGLPARVTRIATDAIPEPDARAIEGDPTRATSPDGAAGSEKTQDLVFPITLRTDSTTIAADGREVPLGPGMSVSVEIKTGRRRILEYLFSPLVEVASSALSER